MSCEACVQMHWSEATVPHDGLRALHKPKRLRPLGHRPVLVQRYQCQVCGANWICESDPQTPDHPEWIYLHHASSILDPLAALEPRLSSRMDLRTEGAVVQERIASRYRFRPKSTQSIASEARVSTGAKGV